MRENIQCVQSAREQSLKSAIALHADDSRSIERLAANNPPQIGIVGKVKIPWFDNVEKGVLKAGQDLGVDASIINPTTDDPAEQVRAIEDLIAKKVDVIGVVPNDGKALEPVLKRAQDAGIKVVDERAARPEERRLGHRADPGQGVRRGASRSLRGSDRRRGQVRRLSSAA